MSKMQRTKGRTAQRELANLLKENDWQVIETSPGQDVEDMVAISPAGTIFSVECKHHKIMSLGAFLKQAREQAAKRKLPWMLCCRLPEYPSTWLVIKKNERPAIWSSATR